MKNKMRKIVSSLILICIIASSMLMFPREIYATSDTDNIVINLDLLYNDKYLYNECIKGIETIVPNTVYEKSVIYTSSSGVTYEDVIDFKYVSNVVFTPNGSDAAGIEEYNVGQQLYTLQCSGDMSEFAKQYLIALVKAYYDLDPISDPTYRYNCHSYAWYS